MQNTNSKRVKLKPKILTILHESEAPDVTTERILDLICPIIKESEQQKMVSVLCSVMDIDVTLNGSRVARFASDVFKAGGTPDMVMANYGPGKWYWDEDWKGKRGDSLTESDIRRTWGKWKRKESGREALKTLNPNTGKME